MVFKDYIAKRRKAARLSRVQLAEEAGIHFTTVQKIETGVRAPSLEVLGSLGRVLRAHGQPFDRLLEELLDIAPGPAASSEALDPTG